MKPIKRYKISELIRDLEVTVKGNLDCEITSVSILQDATPGHISFLTNPLYRKFLAETKASAVILSANEALEEASFTQVITQNPHYIYAKIAEYFAEAPIEAAGVHASAVIGKDCQIDPSASVGSNCVIGDQVKIGAHAIIGAGSVIGAGVEIANDVFLAANVTLYYNVKIGERTRIASGAVIGSDGFGFANQQGAWHTVPQLGTVIIGKQVDIGANTTIDRGAIGDTIIEDGVKLDNLIQVGHNVRIGAHSIVAGCVAIAGSTVIGKHCMIGGASCFAGHITIADKVMITGMTAVTKSITEPGLYSSGIVGAVPNQEFRKNNARFHRLENLMQRVKNLESALKEFKERSAT